MYLKLFYLTNYSGLYNIILKCILYCNNEITSTLVLSSSLMKSTVDHISRMCVGIRLKV